jgi:hypothetical protein
MKKICGMVGWERGGVFVINVNGWSLSDIHRAKVML